MKLVSIRRFEKRRRHESVPNVRKTVPKGRRLMGIDCHVDTSMNALLRFCSNFTGSARRKKVIREGRRKRKLLYLKILRRFNPPGGAWETLVA